jgi:DNA transformation protein
MAAPPRVQPRVPEHVAHVLERLAPLGVVEARRLFSALGLYCDGVIFAIVSKEQIYLKVDDVSRPAFEAKGMEPFRPRAGKSTAMPYFTLPDSSLDDDDALRSWARLAIDAGLRGQARKIGKNRCITTY